MMADLRQTSKLRFLADWIMASNSLPRFLGSCCTSRLPYSVPTWTPTQLRMVLILCTQTLLAEPVLGARSGTWQGAANITGKRSAQGLQMVDRHGSAGANHRIQSLSWSCSTHDRMTETCKPVSSSVQHSVDSQELTAARRRLARCSLLAPWVEHRSTKPAADL